MERTSTSNVSSLQAPFTNGYKTVRRRGRNPGDPIQGHDFGFLDSLEGLTPSPGVKRLVVDAEVMGHLVHDGHRDFL